ncbi:MAG: DUF881 domain-containing protein [Candidatus Dormibacteraceae bacterium]
MVLALTALGFGFFFATQLRSQLIPPSNRVARNQALVSTVQRLEQQNAGYRIRIGRLRGALTEVEAQAARRSDSTRREADAVNELRAHAGLTRIHGPGEAVTIGNGKAVPGAVANTAYLVNFEDVQDVVNVLYEGGAEAIAVNGRRISPVSRIVGAGGAVVIDQGSPLNAPFVVQAVGNRAAMDALLGQGASLGDLKRRQSLYSVQLTWEGANDLALAPYDSVLNVSFARGI